MNGILPDTRNPPFYLEDTSLFAQIRSPQLSFLMEAHDGLSAAIARQVGFKGLWASGLSISSSLGYRDANEASWTDVVDVVERMADSSGLPILVDGDSGFGNFNNARLLAAKLRQRGAAGVCIEDKGFPKMNSFVGNRHPLAEAEEFCGRLRAVKDTAGDDFVLVARIEALIAGYGLDEALTRADVYADAGADAILIHSRKSDADEILAFVRAWQNRLPVVIVPTKYYQTPTEVFRDAGVSVVIWANHLMRSSLAAMQATAKTIYTEQTLLSVEEKVAPLADVFRLQGENELEQAEKRYLPKHGRSVKAVILAASQGAELGDLTRDRPKAMVSLAGKPLLAHILETYRSVNVKELSVVRGYKKDAVNLPNVKYFDNDQFATTQEVSSLAAAAEALEGDVIVSYGDVLLKKYILQELIDTDDDIVIMVDSNHAESRNRGRNADFVSNSEPNSRRAYQNVVTLKGFRPEREDAVHGEWMGIVKLSPSGTKLVREKLKALAAEPARLATMKLPDLLQLLVADGAKVRVIYTTGHWLDVDSVEDVVVGAAF